MGGLKMNNKGEILNSNNNTINGLYGAGEVTGGVHGGNRLGGNSLAECGVFGRISADSAVDYLLNKNNNNSNGSNSDNNDNNNDNIDSTIINKFFIKRGNSNGLGAGGIIAIILGILAALIGMLSIFMCFNSKKDNMLQNHQISYSSKPII